MWWGTKETESGGRRVGAQFLQEWYLDDLVFFHGQNSTRRDEGGTYTGRANLPL